ncbi:MAG: hypothetical protein KGI97_02835 [Alphaproteobacteria bacterium]|nr:hypothetical protein [Alphaproteobacteria bacterium]
MEKTYETLQETAYGSAELALLAGYAFVPAHADDAMMIHDSGMAMKKDGAMKDRDAAMKKDGAKMKHDAMKKKDGMARMDGDGQGKMAHDTDMMDKE